MALHKLQFFISRDPAVPLGDWKSRQLDDGWWLHHCRALPVTVAKTMDGSTAVLLGWAFQLLADRADPQVQLSTLDSEDLARSYRAWTGRWILILGRQIHGDATCSIPVFYGGGVVSSSLCLIRQLAGVKWNRAQAVSYDLGPSWYPGPLSPLEGVARLLPSQTMSLATFRAEHRSLLDQVPDARSLESFRLSLLSGMRRISRWPGPIYLALTGGLDSRTVLASAFAAGIRPTLYTHEFDGLAASDRELPPALAARLGLSHYLVPRGQRDSDKEACFDEHSLGLGVDADRSFYSHGQWDGFPEGSLILRGSYFEIGRAYLHHKIPKDFDPGMPRAAERIHDIYFNPLNRISGLLVAMARRRQSFITEAFREYLSWASNHPEPNLDFRDQFYWEQRHGCWLGTAEQSTDVTGVVRVSIANSHHVLSLMNQASVNDRKAGVYQRATIEALLPAIASYPINPAPAARKYRKRVVRAVWKTIKCLKFAAGLPTQKYALP